jgi:anionic cell wall polymer biosynthesis LytR-Cps2A-Psr (LCP) family protein
MAERRINATILFLVLIVGSVVATGVVLYSRTRTDQISSKVAQGEIVRILVTAHREGEPFFSFLTFYHPETERVAALDIPMSVGAMIQSIGRVDGIDQVFEPEDPTRFQAEISGLAGAAVDATIVFSESQLVDFIDLIGGVELFIVRDYRDVDTRDPLMLPAGNVLLDGRKAVDYLLLEDETETELERVGRRQTFVQSLLGGIQRNADILSHPDVVSVRDRLMTSQLDRSARTSLFTAWGNFDADRLVRRRVQGTVRTVDVAGETRRLLFPHFEGQWLKQSVRQIEQTLSSANDEAGDQALVALEILNGTTSQGLARRTSQIYENFGFEVRRFANAESNQIERTVVIDRRGNGRAAQRVAQIIEAERIVTEVTPDSDVDVTVILGRDFDGTVVRSDR